MLTYFWIGLGGAIGSVARHWLSETIAQRYDDAFPWGTLLVNISGSFVIGLFAALTASDGRWVLQPVARQFVMVGILGGYTTFSAFSFHTMNLAREGQWLWAVLNVVGSVVLCLAAVWVGHMLGAAFTTGGGVIETSMKE